MANMPTAFIASYGSGKPVIAILAEFDALPGLSQKVSPVREEREGAANGHACGHSIFGNGQHRGGDCSVSRDGET
jgi:aminobenzoyl-glutamate utilization protein B